MKKLYAVYDKKAMFYSPIMCFENKVFALREFEQLVRNEKTQIHQYPADFRLDYLGEYDDNNGTISPCLPEIVVEAQEYFVNE